MTAAYPLAWPTGWPRTPPAKRRASQFRTGAGQFRREASTPVTMEAARKRLATELELLGGRMPVLSTNLELRADGQPRAHQPTGLDPGVAVYFQIGKRPVVLACDRWSDIAGNIAAIAAHIGAMRGMDRWGVGSLDRLFEGFAALPPPDVMDWRASLGIKPDVHVTRDLIQQRRRDLAQQHHPDRGGSPAQMAEINAAADAALREIGA